MYMFYLLFFIDPTAVVPLLIKFLYMYTDQRWSRGLQAASLCEGNWFDICGYSSLNLIEKKKLVPATYVEK